MDVAKELACLCGSCPNRPLDECRCGHAGSERERISKALEAGQTKDQVIAGLVGEFGERIFVTPPARGFNLMAWFMPIFGILIGGYAVRSVLRGWSRDGGPKPSASGSMVSDADREKLDSALNEGDA
jgi:cytochrome c-type biogenesis protein CcmH/NrfF